MPGVLGDLWPIYHNAARMGFTPMQVDEMEVWQVAAIFGIGLHDEDGDEGEQPPTIVPYSKGGVDPNLARRIARHLGEQVDDIEVPSYHPKMGYLSGSPA